MALFSQRTGKKPLEKAIQRGVLDIETRNVMWSNVYDTIFAAFRPPNVYGQLTEPSQNAIELAQKMWVGLYKRPSDELPQMKIFLADLKNKILKNWWYDALDQLEFIAKNCKANTSQELRKLVNRTFEQEGAAYRFVDTEIVEISDQNEIESIELAIGSSKPYATHLHDALEFLSDRQTPNLRNSVKESISAVESLCREVTGDPKATLGELLKKLKSKKPMHPAFEGAMTKFYGFTSDEGGIRHGLVEGAIEPDYADAKYFLVLCSAFINYVNTKNSEHSGT